MGLTSMHDLELVLEELQSLDHTPRYATQHQLGYITPRDLLERPSVHVLHAVVDTRLDEEGAVEVDDVGRRCAMQDVELCDDRLELRVIQL
jgi:hypothetical protein